MSLVINADLEKYVGTGATLIASTVGSMWGGVWVKRTTLSTWMDFAQYMNSGSILDGTMIFRCSPSNVHDHVVYTNGGGTDWRNDSSGSAGAGWELVIGVFDAASGDFLTYLGATLAQTGNGSPRSITGPINRVELGSCTSSLAQTTSRSKLAHSFLYSGTPGAGDIAALAGGANPTAVNAANLVYYQPLNEALDETGAEGGLSWAATGTPTFDGADNPTVDAPGGGGGSSTGAAAHYYRQMQ